MNTERCWETCTQWQKQEYISTIQKGTHVSVIETHLNMQRQKEEVTQHLSCTQFMKTGTYQVERESGTQQERKSWQQRARQNLRSLQTDRGPGQTQAGSRAGIPRKEQSREPKQPASVPSSCTGSVVSPKLRSSKRFQGVPTEPQY